MHVFFLFYQEKLYLFFSLRLMAQALFFFVLVIMTAMLFSLLGMRLAWSQAQFMQSFKTHDLPFKQTLTPLIDD